MFPCRQKSNRLGRHQAGGLGQVPQASFGCVGGEFEVIGAMQTQGLDVALAEILLAAQHDSGQRARSALQCQYAGDFVADQQAG